MDVLVVRSSGGVTVQGTSGQAGGLTYMPISSGMDQTNATSASPLAVGSIYLDPANLSSFSKFDFEVVLNVAGSLAGLTAYAKLYDVSGAADVATLSTAQTAQTFLSQANISLPGVAKLYEVRLYISSAADPTYKAVLSMARLRLS